MSPSAAAALAALAFVGWLVTAWIAGRRSERRHHASLRAREKALAMLPAVTFQQIPDAWAVDDTGVVAGSVVIAPDPFVRLRARLRAIAGGRIATYEALLDRARREAILRCKEAARERGYQAVVNLRLETARIPRSRRRRLTAGIEVFAFGTGLELRRDPR
jgi:uncharacterized protein YbjQ (UPF0145 family)